MGPISSNDVERAASETGVDSDELSHVMDIVQGKLAISLPEIHLLCWLGHNSEVISPRAHLLIFILPGDPWNTILKKEEGLYSESLQDGVRVAHALNADRITPDEYDLRPGDALVVKKPEGWDQAMRTVFFALEMVPSTEEMTPEQFIDLFTIDLMGQSPSDISTRYASSAEIKDNLDHIFDQS